MRGASGESGAAGGAGNGGAGSEHNGFRGRLDAFNAEQGGGGAGGAGGGGASGRHFDNRPSAAVARRLNEADGEASWRSQRMPGGNGVVEADTTVAAFVAGCCILGNEARVSCAELRMVYMSWAVARGRLVLPTEKEFASSLLLVAPGLFAFKDGDQERFWSGLRIRAEVMLAYSGRFGAEPRVRPRPASDSADAKGCANGGAP